MVGSYLRRVEEVRRSYTPEKRRAEAADDLPSRFVYRPLSFWITPPFLALGVTADGVTTLGIALSAFMPAVAILGGLRGASGVIAIALVIQLLDCVDGNVARTTGRSTAAGPMLDSLATVLFWCLYFASVGVLAERETSGLLRGSGLEIGLLLATLLLVQRRMEAGLREHLDEGLRWQPPVPTAPRYDLSIIGRPIEHLVAFAVLGLAAWQGRVGLFLAGIASYQILLLVLWLVRYVRTVRRHSRS